MKNKKASSSSFKNPVIAVVVMCLSVGPVCLAANPRSLASAGRTVPCNLQASESAQLLAVRSNNPLAIMDQNGLIRAQRCSGLEKLVWTIRFMGYAAGVFAVCALTVIMRHHLKGLFGQRICCR